MVNFSDYSKGLIICTRVVTVTVLLVTSLPARDTFNDKNWKENSC